MAEPDLKDVRRRIEEIDRQLVGLAAERVQLARRVAEIKRAAGRATIDFGQEKRVLERAADNAGASGLSSAVAQDLVSRLIEASVTVQEEENLRHAAIGAGKSAVIVGGAGRMGRWMGRFLETQGYDTAVIDPAASAPENRRGEDTLGTADLVVCAVPPRGAVDWYRRWTAQPPAGVVVDIASIKTPLVDAIEGLRRAGGRVASIHPMFGPSRLLLRDADVVICDTGDEASTGLVEELFRATTARRIRLPLAEHDRLMGDLLSLSHATAIAFAVSLPENDHPVRSTTFQALAKLAAEAVRESPEVYFEIQADNPHSISSLGKLATAIERLMASVEGRDADAFADLMAEGKRRTAADI
ncbi:MAG: prephenate dehydrogenase/arogenate dehydrogenase family protein [Acidobacteriota bacterium]